MKITAFLLSLFFSLTGSFCEVPPESTPDPEGEVSLFINFDRPWFPQWRAGDESSCPAFGYRMAGSGANLVIHGYDLDPGESIEVENRTASGEYVSRGTFSADDLGSAYLRVETELPEEFLAGEFYYIWLSRESGASVKAGCFYVGESPPGEYYYTTWGNLTYGFSCDAAGKPYLLSWLGYKDGPNILDNFNMERGREFQGDLIDGYPEHNENFHWDSVNPTQGGGDHGRILPSVQESQVDLAYIFARYKPLDYPPNDQSWTGAYRRSVIAGRWPELGWMLETEYEIETAGITLRNKFWHTDDFFHRVHQIRTAQVFLNPLFFQRPPLNEGQRVASSFLRATIDAEKIEVYSDALGLVVSFEGGVDEYESYYFQRQWNYPDYYGLADPGEVQVWECLNVAEINKLVAPGETLSGWGKLAIREASPLGFGFDLERSGRYLDIEEQYYYDWEE